MTDPQTELNPQPKRDIRLIALGVPVVATLTYGSDGKPINILLRAYMPNADGMDADVAKIMRYMVEQANQPHVLPLFAENVSGILREGFGADDIEAWSAGKAPREILEPLLSVLREPPN